MSVVDPIVAVAQGTLRGVLCNGIMSFKGIPYAAPPSGAGRFQPPVAPVAWAGVRAATAYGPTAPKPAYAPPLDNLLPEPIIPGDDYLNLNVWTPDAGATGLPVLVWIHGGAFVNGTGAAERYDGTAFARDGVVCVTINYRLGAEGFMVLDDAVANRGLLDQIAALEWVQQNIRAFGGDPSAVTVAGGSSGAMSVITLLSMPRTRGLFRHAIAQSGAAQHVLTPPTAQSVGAAMADMLDIDLTVDAFAAVPVDQLIETQSSLISRISVDPDQGRWGEIAANFMAFEPVVDGTILTGLPLEQLDAGIGANVELLIGTNTDEQNFFLVPGGLTDVVTEDFLNAVLANIGADAKAIVATYVSCRPEASPGELLSAMLTDSSFRIPAIRVAEARQQSGKPVHVYEFAWRSPQFNGRLGACHGLEVGFAFGNVEQLSMRPLVGDHPPLELAEAMHRTWVNFITGGEPGWEAYEESRTVMRFEQGLALIKDPREAERRVWEEFR
jgi:para-nitrobenzyl esterase